MWCSSGVVARMARAVRKRWHRALLVGRRLCVCPPFRLQERPERGRYLITGPSGTGKSAVGTVLLACGFDVVDADEEIAYHGDLSTGKAVAFPRRASHDWYDRNGWLWPREQAIRMLTDPERPLVFVCGGADNEAEFHRFFDAIFVLRVRDDTLRKRLTKRPSADLTRDPLWIERMIDANRRLRERAERDGSLLIDAERPLTAVVREILQVAFRLHGSGR